MQLHIALRDTEILSWPSNFSAWTLCNVSQITHTSSKISLRVVSVNVIHVFPLPSYQKNAVELYSFSNALLLGQYALEGRFNDSGRVHIVKFSV